MLNDQCELAFRNFFFEGGLLGQKPRIDHSANYQSRIQAGKSIEKEVCDKMAQEFNWISTPSTSYQDKYEGIDGWITETNGRKTHLPFQLKVRKTGNDILWETIKPWNRNIVNYFEDANDQIYTGKDMKCKAAYIISLGNNGSTLRIRSVSETIQKAKEMTKELIQQFRATGATTANTQWGQIKIVKDPSQQANYHMKGDVFKVNCFIRPDAFEWKHDFQFKTPISNI